MYKHRIEMHNSTSAKEVVPIILSFFQPKSVVDIGCAYGAWLSVFKEFGIETILGVDGNNVDSKNLFIEESEFIPFNLEDFFLYNNEFDLVISLEVAEHLHESASDNYIKTLVSLGKVILFSSAIPNQGGDGHINEQWHSYWQKKFKTYDYEYYDVIRPLIWFNDKIDWWYRQNIFFVIHKSINVQFEKQNHILSAFHPYWFNKYKYLAQKLEQDNKELKDELLAKTKKIERILNGYDGIKKSIIILYKSVKNRFRHI